MIAQQRFLAPDRQYAPEEFTDELRQAMTHVKQLAVQCRNNYIGTEHLLWGITTDGNSATRLLDIAGVSVGDLRSSLQARLSLGASQAAERIAFTPYARKALAIAKEHAVQDTAPNIGCDHLLIGLVQIGRGTAATVLNETGLDPTRLITAHSGGNRARSERRQ